jgi:putative phage-type endonuclease
MTRISTKEMTHEEWVAARRNGLGGSDIGVVMGLNKYKTPLQLFNEKIGAVVPDDLSDNPAVEFGNRLEGVVAQKFMDDTGLSVQRDNKIRIHPKYPWAIANIDRMIVGAGSEIFVNPRAEVTSTAKKGWTTTGVLEIKTASSWAMKSWDAEYSLDHFAQLQWYLFVTGYGYGHIALLIDGRYFKQLRIERDETFIEKMVATAAEFWKGVESKTPPPAELPDVEKMLAVPGSTIEATPDILAAIDAHDQWNAKKSEAEKMVKVYKEQIALYMDKNESLTQGDKVVATYKSVAEKFIEAYMRKSYRTLKTKSTKGEK